MRSTVPLTKIYTFFFPCYQFYSKSTLRILLNDIGLIELTRALAGGVLQDAEIKRLKSLSVQSRSQLDVEEMRTMETERKLRASLAQTICLRSRHRITRWNVMTQKLLGRERKRHFGRKVKTLREHTLLLKKMLAHANTKIRKMANKALTDTNGEYGHKKNKQDHEKEPSYLCGAILILVK